MKTLALYALICLAIQKGIVLSSSLMGWNIEAVEGLNDSANRILLEIAQKIIGQF